MPQELLTTDRSGPLTAKSRAAARAERLEALAHQLRNLLNTTVVAVSAIKAGRVGSNGSTAAALDRSLKGMREVIDRVLSESSIEGLAAGVAEEIEVGTFIMDAQVDATLAAAETRSALVVLPVEAGMFVRADRHALAMLLDGLLHSALSVADGNDVVLRARSRRGRVLIEVGDDRWTGPGAPEKAEGGEASDMSAAAGGRLYVRTMRDQVIVSIIDLPQVPARAATAR